MRKSNHQPNKKIKLGTSTPITPQDAYNQLTTIRNNLQTANDNWNTTKNNGTYTAALNQAYSELTQLKSSWPTTPVPNDFNNIVGDGGQNVGLIQGILNDLTMYPQNVNQDWSDLSNIMYILAMHTPH